MNPNPFQAPVVIAAILALAAFVLIPMMASTGWKSAAPLGAVSENPGGAACPLPPTLDILEGSGPAGPAARVGIDDGIPTAGKHLETATFALG